MNEGAATQTQGEFARRLEAEPIAALQSEFQKSRTDDRLRADAHELLRQHLVELETIPEGLGTQEAVQYRQQRGFRLEKLLTLLFELEGLEPWPSFRSRSEQIDGLLLFQSRYFLVESKWHAKELPASTLYEFWGKVSGKLDGTLGLFVSMSGYSKDAAEALSKGKVLNVLLMDGDEVREAFREPGLLVQILDMKIRMAAQKGTPYHSWNNYKDMNNE